MDTISLLVVLIICGFLYYRYVEKTSSDGGYSALRKYLLNTGENEDLSKSVKPILWIHMNYEYNSRNWESFGSRSSSDLNQPYMYLTTKSIINKNYNDFHICIIDDNSFVKLIPSWDINIAALSSPVIENMRYLGLMKLLHMYGGLILPPSFVCLKPLAELFEKSTRDGKMCVGESAQEFTFVGAKKENEVVKECIQFCQMLISTDYTAQSIFVGDYNKWIYKQIRAGKIHMINGKLIGTRTAENEPILIDNLLTSDYINFYDGMYGINIPANEILERTNYNWFARLSAKQVLECKVILAKYIMMSNIPTVERENYENTAAALEKQDVGYWKVPLDAPVYGLMPLGLGDKVIKYKGEPSGFNG